MSSQFIFSGKACTGSGTCVTAKLSTSAWIGLFVVVGTTLVTIKMIERQTSDKESQKKQSG